MSIIDKLNGQPNMQDALNQLRNDPLGMAKKAGYNIPQNLSGNPEAIFRHLVQTGQIGNPIMQRLMPVMQRLGLK